LEALSYDCLVIASDTAPVTEVIENGKNGLLVNFFSAEAIADRVDEALEGKGMKALRDHARNTILDRYDLITLLPQQMQWLLSPERIFWRNQCQSLVSI
jgi:glycosyltransferase involved in cell wall biosynthesis